MRNRQTLVAAARSGIVRVRYFGLAGGGECTSRRWPRKNNPVGYHAAVRLRINDSVAMVKDFGRDWYKYNLQRPRATRSFTSTLCRDWRWIGLWP
jgi:hypothetical protein